MAGDCLDIHRDHVWVATGLGSFETAYPAHQSFPTDLVYDHAHNHLTQPLAETGLPAGLLTVPALAMFFGVAFRNGGERLQREAGWIQIAAALGCRGLPVHSFVGL